MVLLFNLVLPRKRGFTAFFTASWCWILFKAISPFPGGCGRLCSQILCGGPVRNRTAALSVMSQPLYLLSHRPVLPALASVSRPSLAGGIRGASRSGWQRQPESNQRIREPKARALPLGDVSIEEGRRSTTALGCFYSMVDQLNAAPFFTAYRLRLFANPVGVRHSQLLICESLLVYFRAAKTQNEEKGRFPHALESVTGLEPATPCLEGRCSTS